MGAFIVYTFKCFFCLAFFYLFNKLLLGRETFHTINRISWLILIPLSLLLPICASNFLFASPMNTSGLPDVMALPVSEITGNTELSGPDWQMIWLFRVLAGLYLTGVLFFAIRLLSGYIQMFRMVISNKKIGVVSGTNAEGIEKLAADLLEVNKKVIGINRKVYVILRTGSVTPFSWLNYIVIGEEDLMESGTEILRHELSHIQKRHTLDVILADLLLIYQWFNPVAWLLKRSLQQVHEFQADEAVLYSGVDTRHYQLLLIRKAVGLRLFSMVNSFNYSKLKNRISMMLKEKSSKWAYAKYMYVLPLAFAFVSTYASAPVISKLDAVADSFHPAIDVRLLKAPAIDLVNQDNILKSVDTHSGFEVVGKPFIEKTNVRKVLLSPSATSVVELADEQTSDNQVQTFAKDTSASKKSGNLSRFMPENKKQEVFLEQSKAKSGIILNNGIPRVMMNDVVKVDFSQSKNPDKNPPLIIYDGKEIASMQKISPDDIANITVLKDKTAKELYGEKAKNGVIIIVSDKKI